jgi:SAM-dependent methyltransferase
MQELSARTSDSIVTMVGRTLFKRQPKHLTDNEIYALNALAGSGYVPLATRTANEVIEMEYLGPSEKVTDITTFLGHYHPILEALEGAKIRHGDLTRYALVIKDNRPIMIDFAESRYWSDPRLDKRRGGDEYWLAKTMANLCPWEWHNGRSGEMWNIISEYQDFSMVHVLDIGCGYGDFLIRSVMAGARGAWGVDNDPEIIQAVTEKVGPLPIDLFCMDAVEYMQHPILHDVVFCFSVLPYLPDQRQALKYLKIRSRVVYLEVQYVGDGPGTHLEDADMHETLSEHWEECIPIGHTLVKEGRFKRTIWRCT